MTRKTDDELRTEIRAFLFGLQLDEETHYERTWGRVQNRLLFVLGCIAAIVLWYNIQSLQDLFATESLVPADCRAEVTSDIVKYIDQSHHSNQYSLQETEGEVDAKVTTYRDSALQQKHFRSLENHVSIEAFNRSNSEADEKMYREKTDSLPSISSQEVFAANGLYYRLAIDTANQQWLAATQTWPDGGHDLVIWDLKTKEEVYRKATPFIYELALQDHLLVVTYSKSAEVIDVRTGDRVEHLYRMMFMNDGIEQTVHNGNLAYIGVFVDKKREKTIRRIVVKNLKSKKEAIFEENAWYRAVHIVGDYVVAISGSYEEKISVWTMDGKLVASHKIASYVRSYVFGNKVWIAYDHGGYFYDVKNDSFEWPTGHEFRDYHWASDRGGALLVRKEPIGERRFPIGSTIRVMHPDKSVSNFRNDTEQLPLSVSTLQGRTVLGSIIKGRKLIVEEIDLPSPK